MEQKFCKHCGSPLDGETTICGKCGFDGSVGDNFCGYCGKGVMPGQVLCTNCGRMLKTVQPAERKEDYAEAKQENKERYKKYCGRVSRITNISSISYVIAIALGILLFFLPLFQYKAFIGLEDLENMEQLSEALQNDGYVIKDFSMADCTRVFLRVYNNDNLTENKDLAKEYQYNIMGVSFVPILFIFVPSVSLVLSGIILLVRDLKQNNDEKTLLLYQEVNKTGKINNVQRRVCWSLSAASTIELALVRVFAALESFVIYSDEELSFLALEIGPENIGQFFTFTKFSPYIVVIALLVIACVAVSNVAGKEEREMAIEIGRESIE